ncbi:NAD(P)-dependent oxidoreductase [Pedobacter antarcticus]|uniref:Putative NADH-flavin reductase n=2 Tax=Pedobacter antarcticus TaxID=34086 RepID=A0A1I2A176_9SPHI|nr:NAD(P)H-binding protein [Pedobacter antarcticus]SDL46960.1 Putative NADH-flavin reductase [Pedobacter antarcticus]SFE37732.1 Putative NADH-flavin reductase [Pedobacter antarcticus]
MNITIIGASAGIGLATLHQALSQGHRVTALSTQTQSIPADPNLVKINGSATSLTDLKKVMKDADVVIVTIGTKNKKPNTLFSDTAHALVKAGAILEFKAPILIITGFGAGESRGFLSFFMRAVIQIFLKHQYLNKTVMEEIISKSNLNWEIIRPGILTDSSLTQKYKVLPNLYKGIKIGKISRADVAHYLLKEAENPTMLKKYPALTS